MSPLRARAGWILAAALGAALALAAGALLRMEGELRLARTGAFPAATPGAPPAGWADARTRLVVIGDSRVAQWSPLPEAPGLAVWLRGVGGETAAATRARFAADALAPGPDVVVLATGINDLTAASLDRDAGPRVLETAAAALEAMAREAEAASVPLVLATVIRPARPSPLRRATLWHDRVRPLTHTLNARIRWLARARPGTLLLDADRLLAGAAPHDTPLPPAYAADTLHLTGAAYERLNAGLVALLRRARPGAVDGLLGRAPRTGEATLRR